MKIHNYGNDYAFQHRQKKDAAKQAPVLKIVNHQDQLTENVEHQIQTEGEAAMAAAVNQSVESEREELPAAEKAPRKRKKRKEEIFDTKSAPEES